MTSDDAMQWMWADSWMEGDCCHDYITNCDQNYNQTMLTTVLHLVFKSDILKYQNEKKNEELF